jgi:tight adherence protein C
MLLFIAILALVLALYLVGDAATYPARRKQIAMKRATGYGRTRTDSTFIPRPHFRERVVEPSVRRLASIALRLHPKTTADATAARLLAAGLSSRFTAPQFLAIKSALAILGVFVALVFGISGSPFAGILFAPALGVLGFIAPDFLLSVKTRRRRDIVRSELPDALDLLAVSVEAGLGFDAAVTKLTEHMEGALVDEFALTLGEIRIGEGRQEALKKMADRVPAPEVAAFVRSVIQADQLGISLGRILRVQAADSRNRRQAAAEERAMKAPIKMLFPTVMFLFPAMFLVILGPALLNLAHYLK